MKIGIDFRMVQPFPTGVGVYVINTTKALLDLDKTNSYLLLYEDSSIRELYKDSFNKFNNAEFVKVKSKINHPRQYIFLPLELRKLKLDLFITDMWGAVLFCPCKYFVTVHDLLYLNFKELANYKVKMFNKILFKTILRIR